ncbi:MAG: hypothetical protein HUU01_08585 [Saprospiraceae bacterium]|nr:hypothetical protein [Saprospiraceae bacterium]
MGKFCLANYVFTLVLWYFLTGCSTPPDNLTNINGVWIETFPPENQDENRYTADNRIFKTGREFHYRYFYISPQGDTLLFKNIQSQTPEFQSYHWAWDFVRPDSADDQTIDMLSIKIGEGRDPYVLNDPEFNQTVQEVRLYNPAKKELGGYASATLIENSKNVWMQAPNMKLFRILSLNPYPFISAPYKKGHTWQWKVEVGQSNGDRRWKAWGGAVSNNMKYRISGQETVRVPWGEALCHIVDAEAESGLGRTHLKAAFNEEFGFLRLDYTNIDGSKLILELTDIRQ